MSDFCVYTVAKKCYECGTEWDGNSFVAQPVGAPRFPGICAGCLAKDEARRAELMRPVVDSSPSKDTVLERGRSVREYDDDRPLDHKQLAAGDS